MAYYEFRGTIPYKISNVDLSVDTLKIDKVKEKANGRERKREESTRQRIHFHIQSQLDQLSNAANPDDYALGTLPITELKVKSQKQYLYTKENFVMNLFSIT